VNRECAEIIAGLARIFARALAIIAVTLAIAAETSSTASAQARIEKPNITIGVLPITNYGVVYLAAKEGLFQAEGLNVTPRMMGGANAIAALVGGYSTLRASLGRLLCLHITEALNSSPSARLIEAFRATPCIW
jgi:hypothetical protein